MAESSAEEENRAFEVCIWSMEIKSTERKQVSEAERVPTGLSIYLSKTSFEKNCFSAWASTLNMGLINKVDMVCLSPVGYGV